MTVLLLLGQPAQPVSALLPAGDSGSARAATPNGSALRPDASGLSQTGGLVADGSGRPVPRGRWAWPLSPRPVVTRPFQRPTTAYGAGHRGIDLAASAGQPVLAVAPGTVSHVGVIGGKPTVSVLHADGVRSTYEPVVPAVAVDDRVEAGTPLGVVAATGSHCHGCLHLGAVRGDYYLDPLTLLRRGRVRLLPPHGPPERRAGAHHRATLPGCVATGAAQARGWACA